MLPVYMVDHIIDQILEWGADILIEKHCERLKRPYAIESVIMCMEETTQSNFIPQEDYGEEWVFNRSRQHLWVHEDEPTPCLMDITAPGKLKQWDFNFEDTDAKRPIWLKWTFSNKSFRQSETEGLKFLHQETREGEAVGTDMI